MYSEVRSCLFPVLRLRAQKLATVMYPVLARLVPFRPRKFSHAKFDAPITVLAHCIITLQQLEQLPLQRLLNYRLIS
jgi:hypothetical protein